MKKVVVSLNLYGSTGRRLINGILSFLEGGHRNWSVRPVSSEEELAREISEAKKGTGADGFILGPPLSADLVGQVIPLTVPVVILNMPQQLFLRRKHPTAFAHSDNGGIGILAARYLSSLGSFRSYAYVGSATRTEWSERRRKAFSVELAKKGLTSCEYTSGPLVDFLKRLEQPAAVFAAYDFRALEVIDAAHTAAIRIPEQMVVLGVDDDEIFCLTTRPTLSSIRCDNESVGAHAADMMDRFLAGKRPAHTSFLALARDVVERDSSHPPAPASVLLVRALAYISEQATKGITPSDVANHLKVSRRLLDLRFHELENKTIAQAIVDRKLAVFRRLAKTSKLPTSRLAAHCGFKNTNALRNLFRKRTGMTISEFRR